MRRVQAHTRINYIRGFKRAGDVTQASPHLHPDILSLVFRGPVQGIHAELMRAAVSEDFVVSQACVVKKEAEGVILQQ